MPPAVTQSRLLRLEDWSQPKCAGGLASAVLPNPITCRTVRSLSRESQLSFSYAIDPVDALGPSYNGKPTQTVRQYRTDQTVREWEVIRSAEVTGPDGTRVEVECADMLIWLARPGYIRQRTIGGRQTYDFSPVRMTALEVWNVYAGPALLEYGLPWIQPGTFAPTQTLTFDFSRLTPLELLVELARQTQMEYELVPNGLDTGYLVNLVARIGASAPVPDLRLKTNLSGSSDLWSMADWTTVVQARGATAPDGEVATGARAVFRITAVDAVNSRITIEDPNGGPAPLSTSNLMAAGWFLCRENRRMYKIATTEGADTTTGFPQTAVLGTNLALATLSVDGLQIGYTLEFRAAEGITLLYPQNGAFLRYVNAIDTPNKKLTLEVRADGSDPIDSTATSPLFFNRFPGNRVDRLVYIGEHNVVAYDTTTGVYTLDATTFVQTDYVAAPNTSPTIPMGSIPTLVVSGPVDTVNKKFLGRKLFTYGQPPYTGGPGGSKVRFYQRVPQELDGTRKYVTAADAATNQVTLDNISNIAVGDGILMYRDIDALQSDDLSWDAGLTTGNRRFKALSVEDGAGETNLLGNGRLRYWSNPNGLPDWTVLVGVGNSDLKFRGMRSTLAPYAEPGQTYALRIRRKGFGTLGAAVSAGDGSFKINVSLTGYTLTDSPFEVGDTVEVDPSGTMETKTIASVALGPGATELTYTIAGTFANAHAGGVIVREPGAGGGTTVTLNLRFTPLLSTDDTAWTVVLRGYAKGFTGWSYNVNGTATPAATLQDQFDQVNIVAAPVATPTVDWDFTLTVPFGTTDYRRQFFITYLALIPTQYVPEVLPDFSNGNRLQSAAGELLAARGANIPSELGVQIRDLARADAAAFADYRFTLGGNVDISLPPYGARVRRRLLELDENDLDVDDTVLALNTFFSPLSQQL